MSYAFCKDPDIFGHIRNTEFKIAGKLSFIKTWKSNQSISNKHLQKILKEIVLCAQDQNGLEHGSDYEWRRKKIV